MKRVKCCVCWQLESEKNKLENLLKNNLLKKLEQIQADVQEMTSEDIRQRLEVYGAEMESVTQRIAENNNTFKGRCQFVLQITMYLYCNRVAFIPS